MLAEVAELAALKLNWKTKAKQIIHKPSNERQAAILANTLLGAVYQVMKSEYYLAIALIGILLLAFGLFGILRNSHKNVAIKKIPISEKCSTSSVSFLCNKCGKTHTISQSGYCDYIILTCNGEKIMKGH